MCGCKAVQAFDGPQCIQIKSETWSKFEQRAKDKSSHKTLFGQKPCIITLKGTRSNIITLSCKYYLLLPSGHSACCFFCFFFFFSHLNVSRCVDSPPSLFCFSCRISRKLTLTSMFYKQVSFQHGRTTRPCDVRSWASYFCAIAIHWIINSKRWHFYSMSVVPVDSCDFPSTQQQGIRLK